MGIIRHNLRARGAKQEKKLEVIFDSGSTYSLINRELAHKMAEPVALYKPRDFIVADGDKLQARNIVDLAVTIGTKSIGLTAYVIERLPAQLIFGALDMGAYRIKLDPRRRRLDLSEFTGHIYAL